MRSIPTTIQVMPDEPRRPKDMPIDEFLALVTVDVGAWPAELSLRREAMYGDDGR